MISGPKARLTNRDIRCPDMPGIRLPTVEGGPRFRGIAPRQPGERRDSPLPRERLLRRDFEKHLFFSSLEKAK